MLIVGVLVVFVVEVGFSRSSRKERAFYIHEVADMRLSTRSHPVEKNHCLLGSDCTPLMSGASPHYCLLV